MDNHHFTRRHIVGGLGVGMVTAATAKPSFAADDVSAVAAAQETAPILEDPTTKYPKPPFNSQKQLARLQAVPLDVRGEQLPLRNGCGDARI